MRASVLRVLVILSLEAGCTQSGRLGGGHPVVPNAADMEAAAAADKAGNYREALLLYNKVDTEGRDAVASLPSGGPRYVPDGRNLWPGNDLVKEQTLINVASADAAIGAHYEEGHGVPRDYTKARFWYRQALAADSHSYVGNWVAPKLAQLYDRGLGGPPDHAEAQRILAMAPVKQTRAAEADASAKYNQRQRENAALLGAFLTAPSRATPQQPANSAPPEQQKPPNYLPPGYCGSAFQSSSMFWGLAGCGQ